MEVPYTKLEKRCEAEWRGGKGEDRKGRKTHDGGNCNRRKQRSGVNAQGWGVARGTGKVKSEGKTISRKTKKQKKRRDG